MTAAEHDWAALERCCCGNREAIEFLQLWRKYVHAIDDIIDGERIEPEFVLATFASAAALYSHPFYLRNLVALRQIVFNCTNAYADSVAWERSNTDWQRQFSDHYRHFAAEMALAVAGICGGYLHMRSLSQELRIANWTAHHDAKGQAV
jgi:hypothetical protein